MHFLRKVDTSVTFYNISYTDSVYKEVCDSQTVEISSQCENKLCSVELDVLSSECSNYTAINVTILVAYSNPKKFYTSTPVEIG